MRSCARPRVTRSSLRASPIAKAPGGSCFGLEDGGEIGSTALAALPFADDGELAYQRLGEILRQIDPGESGPLVRTITGIALRPRRQTERQDPEGTRFVEARSSPSQSAPSYLRPCGPRPFQPGVYLPNGARSTEKPSRPIST